MNFIYITTNLIKGKQYVGSHKGDENDKYLGSGIALNNSINKYGKDNFQRKILEECDPSLNLTLETKYIKEYNTLRPNGYNISPTGGIGINHYHSIETKKKIGAKSRGRIVSKETRKKISDARKGRTSPTKGKIPWNKGLKGVSEETSEKMSNKAKNRKKQPWEGKNFSEEHKQRISESKKGCISPNKGKKFSDETKEKMRISQQKRRNNEKN
jgi:hypothetical protein